MVSLPSRWSLSPLVCGVARCIGVLTQCALPTCVCVWRRGQSFLFLRRIHGIRKGVEGRRDTTTTLLAHVCRSYQRSPSFKPAFSPSKYSVIKLNGRPFLSSPIPLNGISSPSKRRERALPSIKCDDDDTKGRPRRP